MTLFCFFNNLFSYDVVQNPPVDDGWIFQKSVKFNSYLFQSNPYKNEKAIQKSIFIGWISLF
jgi:hypothetical protein